MLLALWATVLWSLIALQPPLCGENEVVAGHSGLSKAQSHCSRSGALTPSRFLMDFRRHRQTHSWTPNKLIRAPQICGSPIDPRTHPHIPTSHTLFVLVTSSHCLRNWDPLQLLLLLNNIKTVLNLLNFNKKKINYCAFLSISSLFLLDEFPRE